MKLKIKKINGTNNCFFEKIIKLINQDGPSKKKKEGTNFNIKNKRGDINTDPTLKG